MKYDEKSEIVQAGELFNLLKYFSISGRNLYRKGLAETRFFLETPVNTPGLELATNFRRR
jgi:hypothetical protein